jgi:homeobox protein cut-like
MLSIKGREPFIRMQLWLSDTNNIEKLQTLKNERREANKRRRTNTDVDGVRPPSTRDSPLYNFNSNSGCYSPLSGQSFPSNPGSGYAHSAAKKPRILFSEEQKEALRLAFSMDPYPTPATIEFLAAELGLSVRTITNWFHNHRMRLKQVPNSGSSDPDSALNSSAFGLTRDGVTFDTVQFRLSLAQRLAEARIRNSSRIQEKSKFHSLFGSTPSNTQMYGNPNSCSSPGSSTQGDDEAGTLDLSMTSHNHNRISSSRMFVDDSDRSRDSLDDDNDSDPGPLQLDLRPPPVKTGSSRRKPQIVTSSSSRRKPAQPQWVDPGLEFSGDEDEDEVMDDSNSEPDEGGRVSPDSRGIRREVINGVCVRQSAAEKKVYQEAGRKSKSSDDWEDDDNDSVSGDGRDAVRT